MKFQPIYLMLLLSLGTSIALNLKQGRSSPESFAYVHEAIPDILYDILYDIRYAGSNNFIGRPIPGYQRPVALLTSEAADALKQAQESLKIEGYRLKVFDAYRPQRSVNHFMKWAQNKNDISMKEKFYPEVDKRDLFELGYIAEKSGHSRGSTIDLTLVEISTGEELDMGSPYDFFGEISHHGSVLISTQQEANRDILKKAMEDAGFLALPEEWWHYTLKDEPYPETYFDFPVR